MLGVTSTWSSGSIESHPHAFGQVGSRPLARRSGAIARRPVDQGVSFMSPKRTPGMPALGRADPTGADVSAAEFTEADLNGTFFRDVKGFAEAKGLDRAEYFDKIVRRPLHVRGYASSLAGPSR